MSADVSAHDPTGQGLHLRPPAVLRPGVVPARRRRGQRRRALALPGVQPPHAAGGPRGGPVHLGHPADQPVRGGGRGGRGRQGLGQTGAPAKRAAKHAGQDQDGEPVRHFVLQHVSSEPLLAEDSKLGPLGDTQLQQVPRPLRAT